MTLENLYEHRDDLARLMADHDAELCPYPEDVYIDLTTGAVRADYDSRAGENERFLTTLPACDRRQAWDWFTSDSFAALLDELDITEQQAAEATGDYPEEYYDYDQWTVAVTWDLFNVYDDVAREAYAEVCYDMSSWMDYTDAADTILDDLERELAWEEVPA